LVDLAAGDVLDPSGQDLDCDVGDLLEAHAWDLCERVEKVRSEVVLGQGE
jgi:hypothetical protein